MTPGPHKILKIPQTGNFIKVRTIRSGNTFGAQWWTDGKREAPMMPDRPMLLRHPDSGETFWINECEPLIKPKKRRNILKQSDPDPAEKENILKEKALYAQYEHVPFAKAATVNDLLSTLRAGSISDDQKYYIHTRLWWIGNDLSRTDHLATERPEWFDSNLRELIKLLELKADSLNEEDESFEEESCNLRLMIAEALRELGEHEASTTLLNQHFSDDYQTVVNLIQQANKNKNTQVLEIKP